MDTYIKIAANSFMDLKKFLRDHDLNHPAGLCGCRSHGIQFDPCDHDVVIFDESSSGDQYYTHEGAAVRLHHCSINETRTDRLVHLVGMRVISDDTWELGTLISGLTERRSRLFEDHARNRLFDSLFCCERSRLGLRESDPFSQCWQICAAFLLTDAIFALNQRVPGPSHMLDIARRFEKNSTNEKFSDVVRTLDMERATPSLLERMLKSTIGFSDIVEANGHSGAIRDMHDYFLEHSMLSDCYFYLGHVNMENFMRIKRSVGNRPDLIHILKVGFDLESGSSSISGRIEEIRRICNGILCSM